MSTYEHYKHPNI